VFKAPLPSVGSVIAVPLRPRVRDERAKVAHRGECVARSLLTGLRRLEAVVQELLIARLLQVGRELRFHLVERRRGRDAGNGDSAISASRMGRAREGAAVMQVIGSQATTINARS